MLEFETPNTWMLIQVPAHHHHRLALRPHRLLQLQGPPVLQADQVGE